MGFFKNNDETIRSEYDMPRRRIHLNLSEFAYYIIEQDSFSFNIGNISKFANTVFNNYYKFADASISSKIEYEKEKLSAFLDATEKGKKAKEKLDRDLLNVIINIFQKYKTKAIQDKNNNYGKGHQTKIWLNRHNSYTLYISDDDKYYKGKYSWYIKALLEEYARKPFVERERIVFSDYINTIEGALKNTNNVTLLSVVTDKNKKYYIYPYAVMTDPLHTANYLVGYSKTNDTEKIPCSLRISAIRSLENLQRQSGNLTLEEKETLREKIALRGVQFLIGEEKDIIVKMNDSGKEKYNRLRHLRPKYIEIKENDEDNDEYRHEYKFNCTEAQAEFYFLKFGKDAKIISPESLRDKFKKSYKEAFELYEPDRKNRN